MIVVMMILNTVVSAVQVLVAVFLVVVARKPPRCLGFGSLKVEIVDLAMVVDIVVTGGLTFRYTLLLPLLLLLAVVVLPIVLQRSGLRRVQNETFERETCHGAPRWSSAPPRRGRRRRRML